MSRRSGGEGSLFVGRLGKSTRVRDLEDVFEPYGRMTRCEIKYGAEMAYAFVDFEDRRDAEDAIKYENGRDICGSAIIVEWAKGSPRRSLPPSRSSRGYDECYRCHRSGHWARDCPDDRFYGYRRPGRSGRYRSPSPKRGRGRRSRSRSQSPERRRSTKRSRSRSRSRSQEDNRRSRSDSRSKSKRSRSHSNSHSKSRSRSKSISPSRSKSKSPGVNGEKKSNKSKSASRSHSRSVSQE
ncbi:hypothetical protein CHS0354_011519 [Potamilus streckersoni]|uniref:Uncharacterized protein n=1 Tax=Potamilus streckersoni TaxID=2493646 RepID=A0AAE0SKZ6_9BIVA|nr:hypothetical protein CHS0354_011519 [Potamilus streckersoni]